MTGVSREEMRARHYVCDCGKPALTHCGKCERPYPCDAAVLLDALDEAERREQRVRALHAPYRATDWTKDVCVVCAATHPCLTVRALDGPTPATTCADCGTTRTLCDAGLNTNDTRCCEQCGHGEGK